MVNNWTMPSTSLFTKVLGQTLNVASEICQVAATGATGKIGFTLSVVQTSGAGGVNRTYRVDVPFNATGNTWKRLAPYDKTEKFPAQNHWAVDMQSVDNAVTLRLVRTKVGDPASTTTLSCKIIAYASVGETISIYNATGTWLASGVSNTGVFEGAVLTQMDGKLAINSDDPNHTLDVSGNVNATGSFKILGADVISATTLGAGITGSSLTSVGTLDTLSVGGNVFLTALTSQSTGNMVQVDLATGKLSYAPLEIGGALTGDSLVVSGNVTSGNLSTNVITATTITGTLSTSAQPNITSVGTLSSLGVSGNVSVGNLHSNEVVNTGLAYRIGNVDVLSSTTLGSSVVSSSLTSVGTLSSLSVTGNVAAGNVSATSLAGTLETAAQPNITSVGTLGDLSVSGNVAAGNVSATSLAGTLETAAQPNITSVGTLGTLSVTGNATTGNLSTTALSATTFKLNGADWASSVIYGTTTPFTYTGPGSTYSNGVSFYTQTSTTGTAFVTASGTDNSVFTFSTSGTYMLQSEIDVSYPWMPDGDINTFYLVNGNSSVKFGNESHAPNNFSCTRPFLLTVQANDNVRFIIDSSSGNDYEVGLSRSRITMLKLA